MADEILPPLDAPATKLQQDTAKALAAILALLTAARAVPRAAAPIARYGFGVELGLLGEVIGANPLAGTNLLPQPFGFVPPQVYGLPPNYYIPADINPPGFFPGAEEELAEREANKQRQQKESDRAFADALAQSRGVPLTRKFLEDELAKLREQVSPPGYSNPPRAAMRLQNVLDTFAAPMQPPNATPVAPVRPPRSGYTYDFIGTVESPYTLQQQLRYYLELEDKLANTPGLIPLTPEEVAHLDALIRTIKKLTNVGTTPGNLIEQAAAAAAAKALKQAQDRQRYGLAPIPGGPVQPGFPVQPRLPFAPAPHAVQPTLPPVVAPLAPAVPGASPQPTQPTIGGPGSGNPGQSRGPDGRFIPNPSTIPPEGPGNTPGQQRYNPQHTSPSAPTPDNFFAHLHGDP